MNHILNIDRRQFLAGGAALLPTSRAFASNLESKRLPIGFDNLIARLPQDVTVPSLDQTRSKMRKLIAAHPDLIKLRSVGQSKAGDPIEMITIPGGAKSALLVAGVHADEVVGSATLSFLIEELAANAALRTSMGYTWHFINPIDPDGMRWNDSWTGRPAEPALYFANHVRPALARQPDYGFPLQAGSVRFDSGSPENLAFRAAIDLVRPDFLYTMHNCEFGGAFFLTSRTNPALETELADITRKFGLYLNPYGEPLSELPVRAPGIYAMPLAEKMVAEASAAGADARDIWTAGASSTEYAARYGTFAFVAEVPYWTDPRVFDRRLSHDTMSQIMRDYLVWTEASSRIVERWRPIIGERPPSSPEKVEFGLALDEGRHGQARQINLLEGMLSSGKLPNAPLPLGDSLLLRTTLRLISMRPLILLSRLSEGTGSRHEDSRQEVATFIKRSLQEVRDRADLRRVPMRSLIGVQAISGLAAAKAAAVQGNRG